MLETVALSPSRVRTVRTGNTPHVAIILLNWNGQADTLACLNSLNGLDYSSYSVIVVDNGSTDGSAKAIRAAFPGVTLVESPANLGFVLGNNLGVDMALSQGADYLLLLNNDTVVAPDFLTCLVASAEADPSIGIAGPAIYYFDEPRTFWSAGGAIDWQKGSTRMLHIGEEDTGQLGSQPYRVDFVTGCAFLVKARVLRKVGKLDPRFFAYYEEAELCVRAGRAGYGCNVVPGARVWHKISPQAREASPSVQYYMTRNRLLFLRCASAGLGAISRTLILEYGRTLLSWTVRPKWRLKRPLRKAMLRGISDFFSGRFGQASFS